MKALPDLEIEGQRRYVADDAILVEVRIRGTHLGRWRGLPATGRRIEFPLWGVYTGNDRLAGEKIYYDRGTVLRQLGIFHEPQSILGQISILATHPATIARALAGKLLRKWRHAPKTASKRIALPEGNSERRVEQEAGLESTGSSKR